MTRDPRKNPKEGDEVVMDEFKWIFTQGDWIVMLEEDDLELEEDMLSEFFGNMLPRGYGVTPGYKGDDIKKCKKCGNSDLRETESGFQQLTKIWWCDVCKDEA